MANGFVLHRFANGIDAAQPRHRHQRGVRAVKNGDFALFIGSDILYETDIERVTFEPQRLRQRLRPLDNEQPEVFGGIQESIMVAQLRFELFRFLARVAGDDAINQR